jgi:SAM-dependent methyltransferase
MLPNHFDEPVAASYDQSSPEMFEPEVLDPTVDFLAGLAGGGSALELAIGTGRVALPLAARGVRVAGIDLSAAMVARLREKPGGRDVPVEIGDISSTRVAGEFSLVYLVFNTIGNLTSQDAQVACFENAAAHLRPGGCFVIETGVPALRRLPHGERFRVFHHGEGHAGIDEYDAVTQQMWSHHYNRNDDGTYRRASVPFRFAWPAELDLMARIAGLRLRERYADWRRSPFRADSPSHVSVWHKPT